jgi:hypothetical protein
VHLKKNAQLQWLGLGGCGVSAAAVDDLRATLPDLTVETKSGE